MNEIEKPKNVSIQDEVSLSLSEQEQQRLIELENLVRESQNTIKKASFIIGKALFEILDSRLYRATHKTFEEYVIDKFDYTREYAYQLANISHYGKLNSVSAAVVFDRQVRKFAKEFGFDKSEIQSQMRSIIELTLRLICDIAENNSSPVTKPLTEGFFDVVNKLIISNPIETTSSKENTGTHLLKSIEEHIERNQDIIKLQLADKKSFVEKPIKSEDITEKKIATKWRSVELLVKEHLESIEDVLEVEDVSESNLGYDLEVILKNNRRIYVEVKKVSSFNDSFKLTNNEFANATKYAEDYYVALVIHNPFQIRLISNPVAELEHKKVIEQISWKFGDYTDKLQKDF